LEHRNGIAITVIIETVATITKTDAGSLSHLYTVALHEGFPAILRLKIHCQLITNLLKTPPLKNSFNALVPL